MQTPSVLARKESYTELIKGCIGAAVIIKNEKTHTLDHHSALKLIQAMVWSGSL